MDFVPLAILLIVFALIARRTVGGKRLQIWEIMSLGALGALFLGQITPLAAFNSINLNVIFFLAGMFIIGEAGIKSGYILNLFTRVLHGAKNMDYLIIIMIFFVGLISTILLNDTLAIIGTPVMLVLARRLRINHKALLFTLSFAITTGSVMSPIGNPQNLLIAASGFVGNPFVDFFSRLFVPTIINLLLVYVVIRFFFGNIFDDKPRRINVSPIKDKSLAMLTKSSLLLLIAMMIIYSLSSFFIHQTIPLSSIALISALPIIIFAKDRYKIIKNIDWKTIAFFISMFILMQSVFLSGVFQTLINYYDINVTSTAAILSFSIIVSQFLSNVPLVALFIPIIAGSGATIGSFIALAAGSTIAGNFLLLGAASNIIIVNSTERMKKEPYGFLEFAKIGAVLTLLNALVYWIFLSI